MENLSVSIQYTKILNIPIEILGSLYLDVKPEFDDVVWLHNVCFAFGADFAAGFGGLFGTGGDKVGVVYDLGGYKTALKVAVDHAGGLGRGATFFDRPGAHFVFARG